MAFWCENVSGPSGNEPPTVRSKLMEHKRYKVPDATGDFAYSKRRRKSIVRNRQELEDDRRGTLTYCT